MQILIVDDEAIELRGITEAVLRVRPDAVVHSFGTSSGALEFASANSVDVAFLDIELPVMNGLELAGRLKDIHPDINIIFITAYSEYMHEAFRLHASGYLMKPVTDDMIRKELFDLRNAVKEQKKTVRIVTFGNFMVFADDEPVEFQYSKSEEIFAILVDRRGEPAGTDQIKTLIWQEDDSVANHASYISTLKKDMINTFARLGVNDIFRQSGGEISLITEAVQCDLYDYLEGRSSADSFDGRYMIRYAWAEPTIARLENIRRKRGM